MSQNRISQERDKRFLTCVAFQKILKIAGNNPDAVVILFEGEDERYYGSRFHNRTAYSSVVCKGKNKVLDAYELSKRHRLICQMKILAFVDRDHDKEIANQDIFQTKTYSIENNYCTIHTFNCILRTELGVCNNSDPYLYELYYKEVYKKFLDDLSKLKTLSSWFVFQREKENEIEGYKRICVNEIEIDKIIGVEFKRQLKYIGTKCKSQFKWSRDEKNKYLNHPIHLDPIKRYRGKWVLELFLMKLKPFIENAKKGLPPFSKKEKVALNISGNGILSLSSFAETPEELMVFINSHGL